MLGTFFNSRGPVAGIGIAFIMTGLMLDSFIPFQVLIVTPWPLADIAGGLTLGADLPSVCVARAYCRNKHLDHCHDNLGIMAFRARRILNLYRVRTHQGSAGAKIHFYDEDDK